MKENMRIRDLAKQILSFATSELMESRRKLWSDHNSLEFTRPPIYIRSIPVDECIPADAIQCSDPYLRNLEKILLLHQYRMELADDYVMEPFLTVQAAVKSADWGPYGLPAELSERKPGEAARYSPSIENEQDLEKMHVADYAVDEAETALRKEKLADVLGDILPVQVDRQGLLCGMWNNDIATLLAKMRGLEQIMWDAYDRPEWLHRLLSFMQEKILLQIAQTEQADGFRLVNHQNQAMPYAHGLKTPKADDTPVKVNELWGYMAAQEFTTFGPHMFEEFMFDYQRPILEKYALTAYGCCEDLTSKIGVIKKLNNLRRIAVSPFSDVKKCAEQIGGNYVLSWRPNPSSAVSRGVDEDFVRKNLQETFAVFDANGCKFDITLKDVETVSQDSRAIIRWTQIVREEVEKRYC